MMHGNKDENGRATKSCQLWRYDEIRKLQQTCRLSKSTKKFVPQTRRGRPTKKKASKLGILRANRQDLHNYINVRARWIG